MNRFGQILVGLGTSSLRNLMKKKNPPLIVDIDESSLYPSPFTDISIYKSKDNTRKERRILRRASRQCGFDVVRVTISIITGRKRYFPVDPIKDGFAEVVGNKLSMYLGSEGGL